MPSATTRLLGDAGQDVLYGQDGDDTIRGGADDDDVYGELGADLLFGEDGEDAILGDRGGVQNRYETGSRSTSTHARHMPPAVTYRSRLAGSVSREADLLHDVNGTDLVGHGRRRPRCRSTGSPTAASTGSAAATATTPSTPAPVTTSSTATPAATSVFGGRGADAMWGGLGRACAPTDAACQADPGTDGEYVDHLFGGKDEDVIDWRPRGLYGTAAPPTRSHLHAPAPPRRPRRRTARPTRARGSR